MKKFFRHIFMSRIGWCQLAYFIGAVALVLYFFPRKEKSEYIFQEGKPWRYNLLTADRDFPIYKNDAQFRHEQDSVRKSALPFFEIGTNIGAEEIKNFKADHQYLLENKQSTGVYQYVIKAMNDVYNQGIIDINTYNGLTQKNTRGVRIVNRNTLRGEYSLEKLFTPRSAYEYIISRADNKQQEILNHCNLNNYLVANLLYDSIKSQDALNIMLQRIPQSIGMVQKGEKIIGRGDIVTPQIYLILQSMNRTSLKDNQRSDKQQEILSFAGQFIIILILFIFLYRYLAIFYSRTFYDMKKLGFVVLMVTATTVVCYILCDLYATAGMYVMPFAILPITVVVFLKKSIALISSAIALLLCTFAVPYHLEFIFFQLAVTITAINNLKELVRRSQLLRCVILIFLTYSCTYTGYTLIFEGADKLDPQIFFYFGINCTLLFFTYLSIYLLEKTFGFISTVTLVELSDINLPIFRQMSETAPGTFQHSIQVSNLAADAANRIGAQAQLIRTGALYHDIGKLENPAFFTENQSGINPHDTLPYEESAQIIINHVKNGVKGAEKLGLPQMITNFISSHHGLGKTRYFYNKYVNEHPNDPVDEEMFTYPGPNPSTKEESLLMMADSVEAASRSLKEYTEESISKLVNAIIDAQIAEGLHKDSPISFREISEIKAAFIEKLKTVYHTRISYPELKKK